MPKSISLKDHIVLTKKENTKVIRRSTAKHSEKEDSPTYWSIYRKWMDGIDKQIRRFINQEVMASVIIFSFLAVVTLGLLIPLQLYQSSQHQDSTRKTTDLLDSYVDFVVYGDKPGTLAPLRKTTGVSKVK